MAGGFVYLAVVGRYSRRVLSWRLSITMEAAFCGEALKEALARRPSRSQTGHAGCDAVPLEWALHESENRTKIES